MNPPSQGIDLDQFRTQAKELLKLALAADPDAVTRIHTHHPEHDFVASRGDIKLADAQLVVARELGYPSWAKLKEDLLFRKAVQLVDSGNVSELDALLKEHPAILTYHCHYGEWYEQGYFSGATLLHHVAGNPIRCPLPKNVAAVTRLLLQHRADPNIATDPGWTTVGLILTGRQVSEAGVGVDLIDILKAAGAKDDIDNDDVLSQPLWNGGRATAEELARRGAKMELRHAAGLGRVDVMERLLAGQVNRSQLEEALIYASQQGEGNAARLLVDHGATGDVLIPPHDSTPVVFGSATALHAAAWYGRSDIVRLLLENGAKTDVIEPTYNGTALGWAEHGGHPEIAALIEEAMKKQGHPIQTFPAAKTAAAAG